MHVFSKESLELVLMSLAAFLCGICSRYRFNRVGRNQRRCLLWISTQAKSLPYPPPAQTINARVQETSIPIQSWSNPYGQVKAGKTQFGAPRINNRRTFYQIHESRETLSAGKSAAATTPAVIPSTTAL